MSEEWIEDLLDPNYECGACAIEGQPCDVPAAVLAERERIIKVLEDYLHRLLANHGLVILPEEFQSLVRLIKGEQK